MRELPERYRALPEDAMLGGYGEVRKVWDTYLERHVVIKTIRSASNRDQLLVETRAIARARSRHVVEIYDVILRPDGQADAIVLEYLPGDTLLDFWKTVAIRDLELCLFQIAQGLADVHAMGIVHRDVKLENMRRSSSGLIKLFDFGIASNDDGYRTVANRGTAWYAAPELAAERPIVTTSMDIYAFGVCAWALCQRLPPQELREWPPQRSAKAPSFTTCGSVDISIELGELVDRCLSTRPEARPSAAECVELLKRRLTSDRHRCTFVAQSRTVINEINASSRAATVRAAGLGELTVRYNGTSAEVSAVSGYVSANNRALQIGETIPEACVITFGDQTKGASRAHATFVVSHPEVVL